MVVGEHACTAVAACLTNDSTDMPVLRITVVLDAARLHSSLTSQRHQQSTQSPNPYMHICFLIHDI